MNSKVLKTMTRASVGFLLALLMLVGSSAWAIDPCVQATLTVYKCPGNGSHPATSATSVSVYPYRPWTNSAGVYTTSPSSGDDVTVEYPRDCAWEHRGTVPWTYMWLYLKCTYTGRETNIYAKIPSFNRSCTAHVTFGVSDCNTTNERPYGNFGAFTLSGDPPSTYFMPAAYNDIQAYGNPTAQSDYEWLARNVIYKSTWWQDLSQGFKDMWAEWSRHFGTRMSGGTLSEDSFSFTLKRTLSEAQNASPRKGRLTPEWDLPSFKLPPTRVPNPNSMNDPFSWHTESMEWHYGWDHSCAHPWGGSSFCNNDILILKAPSQSSTVTDAITVAVHGADGTWYQDSASFGPGMQYAEYLVTVSPSITKRFELPYASNIWFDEAFYESYDAGQVTDCYIICKNGYTHTYDGWINNSGASFCDYDRLVLGFTSGRSTNWTPFTVYNCPNGTTTTAYDFGGIMLSNSSWAVYELRNNSSGCSALIPGYFAMNGVAPAYKSPTSFTVSYCPNGKTHTWSSFGSLVEPCNGDQLQIVYPSYVKTNTVQWMNITGSSCFYDDVGSGSLNYGYAYMPAGCDHANYTVNASWDVSVPSTSISFTRTAAW